MINVKLGERVMPAVETGTVSRPLGVKECRWARAARWQTGLDLKGTGLDLKGSSTCATCQRMQHSALKRQTLRAEVHMRREGGGEGLA